MSYGKDCNGKLANLAIGTVVPEDVYQAGKKIERKAKKLFKAFVKGGKAHQAPESQK